MEAEEFDTIDETDLQVHEGHPVDVVVAIRLTREESRLLNEVAKREGADVVGTMHAAVDEYVSRRSRRAAS